MHNLMQATQQIRDCQQMIHDMMQQTQQTSSMYQQMLQQEQQNASQLEQLAQRERQAAQIIQSALQGHQMAMQKMNHVLQICTQLEQAVHLSLGGIQAGFQPQGYVNQGYQTNWQGYQAAQQPFGAQLNH